jgi:hypothetical protein
MEEEATPGGVAGGGSGKARAGGGGGGAGGGGGGDGSDIDDLEELWPSRPSSAAAMLARIWVDSPAMSERWTTGLGGVE